MKERPILFSAPMVRAILDGSKTQTRRVVKPQPSPELLADFAEIRATRGSTHTDAQILSDCLPCPYGQPGELIWARESWFQRGKWLLQAVPNADADDVYWCGTQEIAYAANVKRPGHDWRSRPSIHMPRWASRITLEVTGVRVERLQDISEVDAQAEGTPADLLPMDVSRMPYPSSIEAGRYAALWESINGPGSWDANPWVWVVEFKRLEGGAA